MGGVAHLTNFATIGRTKLCLIFIFFTLQQRKFSKHIGDTCSHTYEKKKIK